jgi:hypothetical protein
VRPCRSMLINVSACTLHEHFRQLDIPRRYNGPVAWLYEGALLFDMLGPSAKSRLRVVTAVYSLPIRSIVVRFLPGVSRGVVGSSPLFWTLGICVCSCTIGVCSPASLSLDVRFVMLATAASEDSGRGGPAGVGLPSCVARAYPTPAAGEAVGDTTGTPGEKRLTCGERAIAALPAACAAESGHVSLPSCPPCSLIWHGRRS